MPAQVSFVVESAAWQPNVATSQAWAMDCANDVLPVLGGPRKQRTAPMPRGFPLRATRYSMTRALASSSPGCPASNTCRMRFRSIAASLRFVHGRFSSHSIHGLVRKELLFESADSRARSVSIAARTASDSVSAEPSPRTPG